MMIIKMLLQSFRPAKFSHEVFLWCIYHGIFMSVSVGALGEGTVGLKQLSDEMILSLVKSIFAEPSKSQQRIQELLSKEL